MLQAKLRDLSVPTQIQNCMLSIQNAKAGLKQKIATYFVELKKKICLSLEKAEKSYVAKINDGCSSSIDTLSRVNSTELTTLEVERYCYQTSKLVFKLNALDVEKVLKGFSDQIKQHVQQIRKFKVLEDVPAISEQRQAIKLEQTIKVDSQPVIKILTVNKKLCQITANSVSIQKHTISKHFDYLLPIKLSNKNKQILLALYDSTIGLYSDKLTLHSFRAFEYVRANLLSVVQLGHYVFVAETYKITRINLSNLNEMVVRVFNEEIITIGDGLYQNYVQIGFMGKLVLYDFETLEEIAMWNIQGRPRKIYNIKQHLIVLFHSGLKIYKNLEQVQLHNSVGALKILSVVQFGNYLMLITSQSHIYCLNLETEPNALPVAERVNQGLTKTIKGVVCEGYEIYCLAEAGTKIYVHSL